MSDRLGVRAVTKRFGRTVALDDVSFDVEPGRIVALLGENGAGKTTLLRVVSGFLAPDAGTVEVGGVPVTFHGPRGAAAFGIGMVHQHFLLVPELTVAENVVLGREPGSGPLLDLAAAEDEVRSCAARFGLEVDPRERVGDLGVARRQRVELLKVLVRGARYLLLDEPTGLLPPTGVRELFELVRRLADGGCGVVLVTHRLREVFAVCETATVLRRGRVVGSRVVEDTVERELATLMVGEDLDLAGRRHAARDVAEPLLRVDGLTVAGRGGRPAVDDVSLVVGRGEIVGVAGVAGSGQKELLEALAGVRSADAGTVSLASVRLDDRDVAGRREAGLGYVPSDRSHDGLTAGLSVEENLALGAAPSRGFFRRGWIDGARVRAEAEAVVRDHDVRPPDPLAPAGALSGGNQQKLLIARELRAAPSLLLADEPVRGLDFRATEAVQGRLREHAAAGGGVLVVSTDLPELLSLCDRLLVVFAGRVVGDVDPAQTTEEAIGLLMAGGGMGAQ